MHRGYRDEPFARLKVGMTAKEVQQIAGFPLDASNYKDGRSWWNYSSKQASWLLGDWAWEYRWVFFEHEVVTKIGSGTAHW